LEALFKALVLLLFRLGKHNVVTVQNPPNAHTNRTFIFTKSKEFSNERHAIEEFKNLKKSIQ